MPRSPRAHFYGAVYHVMARGVDGRDIYADDSDRRFFLSELDRVKTDFAADIKAYVLMGNHFHLAIKVAHVTISVIMQRLETVYAQAFNRRHKRSGHLFQARFKAKLCLDDAYLLAVIRYIHLNPVRAGFVQEAHHWPWSSLHGEPQNDDGIDLSGFDPWGDAEDIDLDLKREVASALCPLDALGARSADRTSVTIKELRSATIERRIVAAKRDFTIDALRAGHPLVRIAEWLRCAKSSASRYARAKPKDAGARVRGGRPNATSRAPSPSV